MLRMRILSAIIFFILFFLGLFHPSFAWLVTVLLLVAALTGLREFLNFSPLKPIQPYPTLAMAAAVALLADAYCCQLRHGLLLLGLFTILAMTSALLRADRDSAGHQTAGHCLVGLLYVVLPLAFIMAIWRRGLALQLEHAPHYLIFLVLGTQASDIGAYFTGRWLGRHKLAPRLSPGKTLEGLLGGVAFALLVASALKLFWNNIDAIFAWWEVLCLALVFSLLGPVGDLVESLHKRASGIKDSGQTFTGHGGMLDIIDSLLFTAIAYYVFLWIFHPHLH